MYSNPLSQFYFPALYDVTERGPAMHEPHLPAAWIVCLGARTNHALDGHGGLALTGDVNSTDYLYIMAPVTWGGIYQGAGEHVHRGDVRIRKMSEHEDFSDFENL